MSDAANLTDLGLYVPRSLLESVPQAQRPAYLRAVEEFAGRKYQIAVEVAKQLPGLLADDSEPTAAERYLAGVRTVADADWRAGVEAARFLHHLQLADDPALAESYARIIVEAIEASTEARGVDHAGRELAELERELESVGAARQRVEVVRAELGLRRQRTVRRQDRASELAYELPEYLAQVPPKLHEVYLEQLGQIAEMDSEAALLAAATLVDLLTTHHFTPDGLAEWVGRGLKVLERNIEVGRAFFKMSTKQALADLEELREGLRLRQVARILKLYATALSGKDVMIRATDELDGLELMSVDHIALPGEMGAYEDDDNNFRAYKVATAHGAGRIEFGTYRFRLADIAETVDLLERRYPEAS